MATSRTSDPRHCLQIPFNIFLGRRIADCLVAILVHLHISRLLRGFRLLLLLLVLLLFLAIIAL